MGLALLAHANLPLQLWAEAFISSIHTINVLPSPVFTNFFTPNLITLVLKSLGALVILISVPIMNINFLFVLSLVSSLVIAFTMLVQSASP